MRRWSSLDRTLREKEGEGGGGDGGRKPDVAAQIEGLIASHGDAKAALRTLYTENYDLREDRRKLREAVEGKQDVPKDGLVLDAAQAAAWKQYQDLGKPEDVKQSLQAKADLEGKVKANERKELAAKVATASGYRPEVLQKLPGTEALIYSVKTETVDGQEAEVAYVQTEQGATPQKLTDYAAANWKEFLPALEAEAGGDDDEDEHRMIRQRPRTRSSVRGPKPVEAQVNDKLASGEYGGF